MRSVLYRIMHELWLVFLSRQTRSPAILEPVSAELAAAFPEEHSDSTRARWAFVASWVGVSYTGVYDCFEPSHTRIPRNTFQLLLVAAHNNRSYAMFR